MKGITFPLERIVAVGRVRPLCPRMSPLSGSVRCPTIGLRGRVSTQLCICMRVSPYRISVSGQSTSWYSRAALIASLFFSLLSPFAAAATCWESDRLVNFDCLGRKSPYRKLSVCPRDRDSTRKRGGGGNIRVFCSTWQIWISRAWNEIPSCSQKQGDLITMSKCYFWVGQFAQTQSVTSPFRTTRKPSPSQSQSKIHSHQFSPRWRHEILVAPRY